MFLRGGKELRAFFCVCDFFLPSFPPQDKQNANWTHLLGDEDLVNCTNAGDGDALLLAEHRRGHEDHGHRQVPPAWKKMKKREEIGVNFGILRCVKAANRRFRLLEYFEVF